MSHVSELTTSSAPEADAKACAVDEAAGLETLQLKIGGTSFIERADFDAARTGGLLSTPTLA